MPGATLRWLYLLVALPVLTDIAETGGWPRAPREWLTEVVAGCVIAALVWAVRRDQREIVALARTDALTGLWNRAGFFDAVAMECARVRRSDQALHLVFIDLDHFKRVNDQGGHGRGDRVLQQFARALTLALRSQVDRAFRIGGDEFVLLLPGSTAAQAQAVLRRVRDLCERADPVWVEGPLGISAGMVEFEAHESAQALIARADDAMYREKRLRRA